MNRCESIRAQLTAVADGEASAWHKWRVERHLRGCAACRKEAELAPGGIQVQTALLRQLMSTPSVDVDELRRRVRVAIAAEAEVSTRPAWQWSLPLRPILASATAIAIALVTVSWSMGGPTTMLESFGVIEPPKAVATKTDLFHEYRMFQNLDALENFDSVNAIPLEDEQTSSSRTAWVG